MYGNLASEVRSLLSSSEIAPAAPEDELAAKLLVLEAAVARTRRRVSVDRQRLLILRAEFENLKNSLEPAAAPRPAANAVVTLGRLVAPPAPRRSPSWLRTVPYAVLAALVLALGSRSARKAPSQDPLLARVPTAGPALPPPSPTADAGARRGLEEAAAPELSEEQASDEILRLVYAYRPAGSKLSVERILGPEIESSAEASPWVIERTGVGSYSAVLRPYGDALGAQTPVYEFEVDLVEKSVTPSPETAQNLSVGALADSRAD